MIIRNKKVSECQSLKISKKIIPTNVRLLIRRVQCQVFGFENDFKNMSNTQVFNKIYKEGIWGTNEDGESLSGRGSHTNEIIQPYISEVSKFLLDVKPQIVVDLGCGDFHIGKILLIYVKNILLVMFRVKF